MYLLSRLLLILSVLLFGYSCAVVAFLAKIPPLLLLAFGLALVVQVTRKTVRLTAFGTAKWSETNDLRSSGMLGASQGLILGRTEASQRAGRWSAVGNLFNPMVSSTQACQGFMDALRVGWRKKQGEVVRLPNAVHTSVFAPTGVGKGVSCIVPFLLTCEESCVVIDCKSGENALLTAEHRRRMGHKVVILDPYKVVAQSKKLRSKSASLNPVDFITANDPHALDDCRDMSKMLVIRTGQEKGDGVHFLDGAEQWIAAVLAAVVQFGKGQDRSLQALADILANPQKMSIALNLMQQSKAWDGMLSRMGHELTHFRGDELGSVLTTVGRFLSFLSTPAMAESTRTSSFNPSDLRKAKMTIYVVLPPDRIKVLSGWLRMVIGTLLRAVVRGGLKETHRVHFVLDEASALGQMDQISEILAIGRGYGARLHLYYQDCGQLKKCWPEGQDQTLLANTTQVFFGVNDHQTAEYVSARLGEQTIIVDSGGTSRGGSSSWSEGGQRSAGGGSSWNGNSNWAQQARKLLKPEEVAALPPRTAITFTPGQRPVYTTLLRYYEEAWLWKRTGWFSRRWQEAVMVTRCLILLAIALVSASLLAEMALREITPVAQSQPVPQFDPGASPKGSAIHP